MCECSRCKKTYEEYELQWVEIPNEYSMQIVWTGRGKAPSQEKKMELVCDNCLKEKPIDKD
tara:strand:+ start:74 stop:256 length:183 start_codon:yes stop_codon:yes gene_type:complete